MISNDQLLDEVRAEVAYRREELYRAGRSRWVARARSLRRRLRARRAADVTVPEQPRREAPRERAGAGEQAR